MDMDMDLVTSEELLEELKRRHEVMIFVAQMKSTPDYVEEWFEWQGPMSYCIGLSVRAKHRLLKLMDKDVDSTKED